MSLTKGDWGVIRRQGRYWRLEARDYLTDDEYKAWKEKTMRTPIRSVFTLRQTEHELLEIIKGEQGILFHHYQTGNYPPGSIAKDAWVPLTDNEAKQAAAFIEAIYAKDDKTT